jgi:hypothetical protein
VWGGGEEGFEAALEYRGGDEVTAVAAAAIKQAQVRVFFLGGGSCRFPTARSGVLLGLESRREGLTL